MTPRDSGATPRNTPVGSRGATSGNPAPERDQHAEQSAAVAKRTEKTADRGTDLAGGMLAPPALVQAAWDAAPKDRAEFIERIAAERVKPVTKPRKRTVGSISIPELPWKRGE